MQNFSRHGSRTWVRKGKGRFISIQLFMIQTPSIIHKIGTLVDGSIRITLDTPELTPDSMTQLFELRNKSGWFLFSPNKINSDALSLPDVRTDSAKTPGQRLRGVLFLIWQSLHSKDTFETFYIQEMERIIEMQKERLE